MLIFHCLCLPQLEILKKQNTTHNMVLVFFKNLILTEIFILHEKLEIIALSWLSS